MKKVVVIGCPGIGAQEFGKELSKNTGVPYHDINEAYRLEEKNIPFDERVRKMTKKPTWIIVGNYVGTSLEIRLKECDTIFFLDYSRELCRDLVKVNPDTGITWSVVLRFYEDSRPEILKMLEKYSEKIIFTFKTEGDKDCFVDNFLTLT